ncbi:DUF2391 family protein [Halorhabdus sp. CBA1104]|uniref:DUF2391 family protein n=1 Tax=unclassified Halorhabdus TaxID=2621901 RepID=UPI0012B1C0E7|nr:MULTISPECIES: DUF2391 family protein [unclassified Halorhabdus]QGN05980.1 DUF2391 family protein [Halorhabdus sp. CBA1104]
MALRNRYQFADTAQQVVGGFLLAGPFVVTEEVWMLARQMSAWHALTTALLVAVIGYGALYQADDDRDPGAEAEVAGLPLRFLSLMAVAFGSVTLLALLLNAPASFLGDVSMARHVEVTLKVVSVGAIFSVVGAATADSVF